eukprot:SAG11_NODE_283_length_11241_cov_8.234428_10_plen_196_part_00
MPHARTRSGVRLCTQTASPRRCSAWHAARACPGRAEHLSKGSISLWSAYMSAEDEHERAVHTVPPAPTTRARPAAAVGSGGNRGFMLRFSCAARIRPCIASQSVFVPEKTGPPHSAARRSLRAPRLPCTHNRSVHASPVPAAARHKGAGAQGPVHTVEAAISAAHQRVDRANLARRCRQPNVGQCSRFCFQWNGH